MKVNCADPESKKNMALQVTAVFASGYHHDVYKIKKSFFVFFLKTLKPFSWQTIFFLVKK